MLKDLIVIFSETCKPANGKKQLTKKRKAREHDSLCKSIDEMLDNLPKHLNKTPFFDTVVNIEMEKALVKAFEKHCLIEHERNRSASVSGRGDKSKIFPWDDPETYDDFEKDRKLFKKVVLDNLDKYPHADIGHRPGCKRKDRKYHLRGYRSKPRKPIMPGSKQNEKNIRMAECINCKQRFSLLPSFLPREKHYSIELIGNLLRNIALFGHSVNAVIENMKSSTCGRGLKSKQTVYNWIRWIGTFHPATLMTRAGATCSGYFQEDEGFEKEPDLRTYTVVMVDPETQAVWHMDYTDHVDEDTLSISFESFLKLINFSVKGVTKDRWEPSTKALKSVFYRVWIGFCHLHCLKKFYKALKDYQKESQCDSKEVNRLYKIFKNILETSTHANSLKAKLKSLNEKAFDHPLLKVRIDEIRDNAVHYTSNKNRRGITPTTSMVDNFLKIVKRKLRQVSSFRDKDYTKLLFNALANIRNFVPFLSGAKNAHESPFMIAQGETYDLPWMQTLNMHNAFLFASGAF